MVALSCSDDSMSSNENQTAKGVQAAPSSGGEDSIDGQNPIPDDVEEIAQPVDINGAHLVNGIVLKDQTPVEKAKVYILGYPDAFVLTDEEGYYTINLPSVDSSMTTLSLVVEGQGAYENDSIKQDYTIAEIQDNTANYDISILKSGSITGRLFLPGVNNYSGYVVSLEGTNKTALSSADGSYTFNNIPSGTWPLLKATHPNLKTIEVNNLEVKTDEAVAALDRMLLDTMTASTASTCAVKPEGTVFCWGHESTNASTGVKQIDSTTPVTTKNIDGLTASTTAVGIEAGRCHVCTVMADGSVMCWGCSGNGKIGDGKALGGQYEAVRVQGIDGTSSQARAKQLALAERHSCALMEDSSIKCWGHTTFGALGNGVNGVEGEFSPVPVNVSFFDGSTPEKSAKYIDAGRYHTCAINLLGEVYCWGGGQNLWANLQSQSIFGELGNAINGDPNSPRFNTVPTKAHFFNTGNASTKAKSLHLGEFQSCAIVETGATYCWGRNTQQLGLSEIENKLIPAPMPDFDGNTAATRLVQLSSSTSTNNSETTTKHSCGLTEDNEVWCWGSNESAQLGNDNTVPSNAPIRASAVASNKNVVTVKTGSDISTGHSCILLDTGKIECWGNNKNGQLGSLNLNMGSLDPREITGNHVFALPTHYKP